MQSPDFSKTCTHTFADRHIHGIAGVDFATSSEAQIRAALALLRRRRTTRVTASLPTMSPALLQTALATLGPLVHESLLDGVHLEGPFIASQYAGAHPRDAILTPDSATGQALLRMILDTEAAGPSITMMTLAPELPGFDTLAADLVAADIIPALGHTDASYHSMRTGIQHVYQLTGQPVVITHAYNAMRGFHHRDPGPMLAIMEAASAQQVVVELIADGNHVAMEVIRWWFDTYPEAVRLVSDASAATLPAGVVPLTSRVPRLGQVELGFASSSGPKLADRVTLASGAQDLVAIHQRLVEYGFDHDLVCGAMQA